MNLILFFNGWGMDENCIKNIILPRNFELKIINFPYIVENINFSIYDEIIPIGWSFGSYYLSKYILENNLKFKRVISINGTPETIGNYGITPKIFEFTLNTLTPDSLLKFYKNMGIDENFILPNKNFEDIKKELEFFKLNYIPLKNIFTEVIIGTHDKIIPAMRIKKYFTEKNIAIFEIDAPHFIFSKIKSWSDILERNNNEF